MVSFFIFLSKTNNFFTNNSRFIFRIYVVVSIKDKMSTYKKEVSMLY